LTVTQQTDTLSGIKIHSSLFLDQVVVPHMLSTSLPILTWTTVSVTYDNIVLPCLVIHLARSLNFIQYKMAADEKL